MRKILVLLFILSAKLSFGQKVTKEYIMNHQEMAIDLMNTYHLPASLILGIAIHESGSGTSKIAKYLNNHFGVKGKNNSTQISSAYKGYESIQASFQDFIGMMQRRPNFSKLFDKYDESEYKKWALGIQKGGYAASKTWATQVINIINKYKLYELDKKPVIADKKQPIPLVENKTVYIVKKGDTLGKIALEENTTVKNLMEKNHLKSTQLQIGQALEF